MVSSEANDRDSRVSAPPVVVIITNKQETYERAATLKITLGEQARRSSSDGRSVTVCPGKQRGRQLSSSSAEGQVSSRFGEEAALDDTAPPSRLGVVSYEGV